MGGLGLIDLTTVSLRYLLLQRTNLYPPEQRNTMTSEKERATNALRRAALLARRAGLTESEIQEALKPISQPQADPAAGLDVLAGGFPGRNPFRPNK